MLKAYKNRGVYSGHFPPPLEGGGKKRHFLEFGEENRPLERKKFLVLLENLFSIKTLALKEILKSINFLTGEE